MSPRSRGCPAAYSCGMEPVRPLREVFAQLSAGAAAPATAGDAAELLAAHGHPGLPPDLVAEAIINYADAAPLEVAEHLAPFVTAHGPVPLVGPQDGPDGGPSVDADPGLEAFRLLATAPAPSEAEASEHLWTGAGHEPGGHVQVDAGDPGHHPAGGSGHPEHDLGRHDLSPHDLGRHDLGHPVGHPGLGPHEPGQHELLADPADLDFGAGRAGAAAHSAGSVPGSGQSGLDPEHGHLAFGAPAEHLQPSSPEAFPAHGLDTEHAFGTEHAFSIEHGFGSGSGPDAAGWLHPLTDLPDELSGADRPGEHELDHQLGPEPATPDAGHPGPDELPTDLDHPHGA